ncbi:hypothetical protein [Streptomyces antimicrobicus]|uniref:Gram-positive cocci surface proteins LPxTG domain-containing protein n=1 Tax=Streptomyces antimicrobicus TaxID=2883108 RepID=A0ABS8BBJ7_9ACTN|nr:hypothetical protein [Streptomyces antimicrobicus]MCB5182007.1 hypothetical protein [Streptomyces antimicrobicus]
MSTVRRRTLTRAAAVTACAGSLLALPAAAALADGVPAAAAAHSAGPQRTLVKSLSLADGVSVAKVYRVGAGGYEADVIRDGATVSTLTSRAGATGYGSAGTLYMALGPDGSLSSWTAGGAHPSAEPVADGRKTATRTAAYAGTAPLRGAPQAGARPAVATEGTGPAESTESAKGDGTGRGTVSGSTGEREAGTADGGTARTLRLHTLADGPGEGVLMLAAGGGMAAVGAAGLGFAMLRRGRSDS